MVKRIDRKFCQIALATVILTEGSLASERARTTLRRGTARPLSLRGLDNDNVEADQRVRASLRTSGSHE